MTGRGPAPGWTDPEPHTFRARSGDTVPEFVVPGFARDDQARPEPPRSRRRHRLLRRAAAVLGVLVFLIIAAFGVLLLVTPSAGRAPEIARAQGRCTASPFPARRCRPGSPSPWWPPKITGSTQDPGIDPIAVGRVALGYLTGSGPQQGGATITQQLAKMLYTPGHSSFASEAEQVMLAVKLNFAYSKVQILQMYADVAYFGQDFYSLGAASCGYFGVMPARLTWPQAAMLAGLVQAPSAYDPLTHPALAHEREAHVLSRLAATGTLTRQQANAALAQPLHLVPAELARAAPARGASTCGRTRT